MNKFLKIIVLTSIVLFSSCVNDSNPEEFTVREYKKIRNEITEFFENEDFTCKNERNKADYEEWFENDDPNYQGIYIDPVVCRKKSEQEVDGNVYKSEIIYELSSYDNMVYKKDNSKNIEQTLSVKNSVIPKEKYLNEETIMYFYQDTIDKLLYLYIDEYDEISYSEGLDSRIYIWMNNSQEDGENYKYYQDIFKEGLPKDVKERSLNPEEKSDYFDLLVEKGYAENLLNEFKVNKEEADEIAKRFEKSEIYDKIYNLKY